MRSHSRRVELATYTTDIARVDVLNSVINFKKLRNVRRNLTFQLCKCRQDLNYLGKQALRVRGE